MRARKFERLDGVHLRAQLPRIIQLVEQSHLPVRRTLAQLGIAPSTFYRWYDRYQSMEVEVQVRKQIV